MTRGAKIDTEPGAASIVVVNPVDLAWLRRQPICPRGLDDAVYCCVDAVTVCANSEEIIHVFDVTRRADEGGCRGVGKPSVPGRC